MPSGRRPRRHEAGRGEGNGDQVVGERPADVLPHHPARPAGEATGRGQGLQVPSQQDEIAGEPRKLWGLRERDGDGRGRQRGRVVQAVAHEEDAGARRFPRADPVEFLLEAHSSGGLVETERSSEAFDRFARVAGEELAPSKTFAVEVPDQGLSAGAEPLGK